MNNKYEFTDEDKAIFDEAVSRFIKINSTHPVNDITLEYHLENGSSYKATINIKVDIEGKIYE